MTARFDDVQNGPEVFKFGDREFDVGLGEWLVAALACSRPVELGCVLEALAARQGVDVVGSLAMYEAAETFGDRGLLCVRALRCWGRELALAGPDADETSEPERTPEPPRLSQLDGRSWEQIEADVESARTELRRIAAEEAARKAEK